MHRANADDDEDKGDVDFCCPTTIVRGFGLALEALAPSRAGATLDRAVTVDCMSRPVGSSAGDSEKKGAKGREE